MPDQPIHNLVIDAGPLIASTSTTSLLSRAQKVYTTPSVIAEIRDAATRSRLETTWLPFLQQRTPGVESIRVVSEFAKKTGDFSVLSVTDLQLLALTYELELEENKGDWRLRRVPGQMGVNGPVPKKGGAKGEVEGGERKEGEVEKKGEVKGEKVEGEKQELNHDEEKGEKKVKGEKKKRWKKEKKQELNGEKKVENDEEGEGEKKGKKGEKKEKKRPVTKDGKKQELHDEKEVGMGDKEKRGEEKKGGEEKEEGKAEEGGKRGGEGDRKTKKVRRRKKNAANGRPKDEVKGKPGKAEGGEVKEGIKEGTKGEVKEELSEQSKKEIKEDTKKELGEEVKEVKEVKEEAKKEAKETTANEAPKIESKIDKTIEPLEQTPTATITTQEDPIKETSTEEVEEGGQPEESSIDDSDNEGWITASNIHEYKAKDTHTPTHSSTSKKIWPMAAALATTDFAMQNVLLQMNLHLVSPNDLQRIRMVKTWVLRCHACFKVCRDMNKQFCPSCGGATLLRVSCSTDTQGVFRVHLKKHMQWSNRGNVYSIPKAQHGSASGKGVKKNLILREDQVEYQREVRQKERQKERDLLDPDYLPGILTGERRDMIGSKPKIGYGRVNPNEGNGGRSKR